MQEIIILISIIFFQSNHGKCLHIFDKKLQISKNVIECRTHLEAEMAAAAPLAAVDAASREARDSAAARISDLVVVQIAQFGALDSAASFGIPSCRCNGNASPCGRSSDGRWRP